MALLDRGSARPTGLFLSILCAGGLVAALVGQARQAPVQLQVRDPASVQPATRVIPVGSSSLSGTVVAADTGRPVRGARVSVSGIIVTPGAAGAAPAGRGGLAGGVPGGVASGVLGAPVVGTAPQAGLPARGGSGVQAGSVQGLSRMVMTDADGQFTFPRMPAGQFTLSINHNLYLTLSYGQKRPGGPGTPISLAEGQKVSVKVSMLRGGVITGTVIGDDGEPQRNAQVRGWRYTMTNGFRRLQSTGFATTDDRGIYRLFGMQPGEYVVSATPSNMDLIGANSAGSQFDLVEQAIASGPVRPPAAPGQPPTVSVTIAPAAPLQPGQVAPAPTPAPTYLPTYGPSSLVASGATSVTVVANEERSLDIRVRLAQASTVQGSLTAPPDPNVRVQVYLTSDDPTVDAPPSASTGVDASGRFTFRTVTPGNYTVYAQTVSTSLFSVTIVNGQVVQSPQPPALTDAQKRWGKAAVSVEGQSTVEVSLTLTPCRSISGVVLFEMQRPPDLSRTRVMVTASPAPSPQSMAMGPMPQAQIGPDGRFTLTGVMPGRLFLRTIGGGTLKSAMVSGEDTLDFPLEFTGDRDVTDAVLTVTDRTSELSGTLTDSLGKPASDYTIVVAASDNRYWTPGSRRIAVARPVEGLYSVRTLPPGSYLIAAVADFEQGVQYDPEFLRTLAAAAVPVTLTEGGKVTQDLRVR